MVDSLKCVSPVDGSIYVERPLAKASEIAAALAKAQDVQAAWRSTPLAERQALLTKAVDAFVARRDAIAEEITWQMGRPISQGPGEVAGFEERARHMIKIAPGALADLAVEPKDGFTRFIRRDPLGVVFVVAPWNFPYLTAVNSVIPALLAGNAVILKHSAQTPLCAERFAEAFATAGLPDGVFQFLHLGHEDALKLIGSDGIDFVSFTGSVNAGRAVQTAGAKRFIGMGLELGGKDPAYVRPDVKLEHAIETLVDGAMFNSGQSCCGIERIYVHSDVYDDFVEGYAELVRGYRLGNPLETETNLGPMVKASAADFVRGQSAEAVAQGAQALIDSSIFAMDQAGTPYLAPQVLCDVNHDMRVMTEESFGPVVGLMKVASDEEAIGLMNDSDFGLTASIWTQDQDAALEIGDRIETGTWFMNRCDYLDPALAWTGVKDSGRGCSLSQVGFEQLTRPKSFHLRTAV
ncbi:aldehyde dehydrogenase family protein [Denitrobaculum tricleocarpae]|uniref:Aldehyde dehydrogenase family protein n=1 Tax=Denitrobaculum tricleocarpae TaxID=2591009 RepID=A0A545TXX3_9PROT|nr:aldehyde dehydrogenase family protein [Denitrobaculum tricleocarpae]TQV82044.1 aldehyde dehydrogenase family protein [Denitrobaculum tricleocarpae]